MTDPPADLTTTRYIVAAHIHDAHCDDAPCYDATIEQHRKAPTADDYARADRLIATLIPALTSEESVLFGVQIEHIEDIPVELTSLFIKTVKAARHVQDAEIKSLHRKLADARAVATTPAVALDRRELT